MYNGLESITRPSTNIPAKTIPIEVSSLLPVRLLMNPISRAIPTPAGTAAISALPVASNPTPIPGSTE